MTVCAGIAGSLRAAPLVDFPTENHSLAEGRPADFFMYVDRDFEGEKSKPWQGGQYGYVRGPRRAGDRVIYTHLHEGIDIRPMHRDAAGHPTDVVRAAADGTVVHTNPTPGASNYGRYVVVEHRWNGSPFYSLYAHLATIAVTPGQSVRQGETLGGMGFTGAGINLERAHVHFEVCLLLSPNYDGWHAAVFPTSPNRHGRYNGLNLVGVDPAALLLEARRNPNLQMADFVRAGEPWFKIRIPNSSHFALIRNYPWLVPPGEVANPRAWTITFTRHGVPVRIEASSQPTPEPVAVWVKPGPDAPKHVTKGLVGGTSSAPVLTDSGVRFARLLVWPD